MLICLIIILHLGSITGQLTSELSLLDILDGLENICDYKHTKLNPQCSEQLEVVCKNETLIYTMLDASSKIPSGVAFASKFDLGNFDECLTIDHSEGDTRILGKHCAAGLVIPNWENMSNLLTNLDNFNVSTLDINAALKLSLCVPDACTASDMSMLVGLPLEVPLFNDIYCATKETGKTWTVYHSVFLLSFLLIIILLAVSTIYDMYSRMSKSKPANPILLSFSVLTNGKKILNTSKATNEHVLALSGIKVISMMWIIAGHGVGIFTMVPLVTNENEARKWEPAKYSLYLTSGYLAVDTFFFISGFLLAFHYLKEEWQPLVIHLKRVPILYFHRYLRITPAAIITVLFTVTFLKHIGSGPIYQNMCDEILVNNCVKHWWSFLLYIQNYNNYDEICLIQTWFLSADMQMFLLSPIILIPVALYVRRNTKVVFNGLILLNLAAVFVPFTFKLFRGNFENIYETHTVLSSYLTGFILGVYMRQNINKPFQFNNKINIIIWTTTIFGMLLVIWYYKEIQLATGKGNIDSQAYYIILKPIWCTGLSWMVYSCHKGSGGIINWFLSRPIFQIVGKLCYSMYLTHIGVILICYGRTRSLRYFDDYEVYYLWCGHFITTMILSLFWTLAFESPIVAIENSIRRTIEKKVAEEKAKRIDA